MFDYFRKMKVRSNPEEVPHGKPKKDKVFIGILIVFSVVITASIAAGAVKGTGAFRQVNYGFKFSIADGIILGAVLLAYVITRIRKGRR